MTPASAFLLALVFGLLFFDYATWRKRGLRMFAVEAAAFLTGAFFIAVPDAATRLAHAVGIGRGVDFVLYPLVIWLVREALVSRQRRFEESERLTRLVRTIALQNATPNLGEGGRFSSKPSDNVGENRKRTHVR